MAYGDDDGTEQRAREGTVEGSSDSVPERGGGGWTGGLAWNSKLAKTRAFEATISYYFYDNILRAYIHNPSSSPACTNTTTAGTFPLFVQLRAPHFQLKQPTAVSESSKTKLDTNNTSDPRTSPAAYNVSLEQMQARSTCYSVPQHHRTSRERTTRFLHPHHNFPSRFLRYCKSTYKNYYHMLVLSSHRARSVLRVRALPTTHSMINIHTTAKARVHFQIARRMLLSTVLVSLW